MARTAVAIFLCLGATTAILCSLGKVELNLKDPNKPTVSTSGDVAAAVRRLAGKHP